MMIWWRRFSPSSVWESRRLEVTVRCPVGTVTAGGQDGYESGGGSASSTVSQKVGSHESGE